MNERTKLEDLLPKKQLGEVLQVTTDTIEQWVQRGLPCYRLGRQVWFSQFEVVDFIKDHLQAGKGGQRPSA